MWVIQATIATEETGIMETSMRRGSRQVPTFYLSEHVQGVSSERHAVEVAKQIIDPLGIMQSAAINVTAIKMEGA